MYKHKAVRESGSSFRMVTKMSPEKLTDLQPRHVVHIPGAAGEATPVGEDHDRQVLATVEIPECLVNETAASYFSGLSSGGRFGSKLSATGKVR